MGERQRDRQPEEEEQVHRLHDHPAEPRVGGRRAREHGVDGRHDDHRHDHQHVEDAHGRPEVAGRHVAGQQGDHQRHEARGREGQEERHRDRAQRAGQGPRRRPVPRPRQAREVAVDEPDRKDQREAPGQRERAAREQQAASGPQAADADREQEDLLHDAHAQLVLEALEAGEDGHRQLDERLEHDRAAQQPGGERGVERPARDDREGDEDETGRHQQPALEGHGGGPVRGGVGPGPSDRAYEDRVHPEVEGGAEERGQGVGEGELAEVLGPQDARRDDDEAERQEPRRLHRGLQERVARDAPRRAAHATAAR